MDKMQVDEHEDEHKSHEGNNIRRNAIQEYNCSTALYVVFVIVRLFGSIRTLRTSASASSFTYHDRM